MWLRLHGIVLLKVLEESCGAEVLVEGVGYFCDFTRSGQTEHVSERVIIDVED